MPSARRLALMILAGAALLPAAVAAQEPWDCYGLTYPDSPEAPAHFPVRLALARGGNGGAVISKAGPADTIGFWRMFQNIESRWQAETHDSISVHFTNGFTGAQLRLSSGAAARSGTAEIRFDFGNPEDFPPVQVRATSFPCEADDTDGPERDPGALAAASRRRERERLVASERERLRAQPSPLAGTYRLEVSVPGWEPSVMFVRTVAYPSEPQWVLRDGWNTEPADLAAVTRAEGYSLEAVAAFRLEDIPRAALSRDRDGAASTVLIVATDSSVAPSRWRGLTDILFAASRLSEGAAHEVFSAASRAVSEIWFERLPGELRGEFVRQPDGGIRFSETVWNGGRVVLHVEGMRIDVETVH